MKYFDCHADTLTQVIKEGESLEKNTLRYRFTAYRKICRYVHADFCNLEE